MTSTIYYTACTLDGFIATSEHSLDWLLHRDVDEAGQMAPSAFMERVGATVMGANTWQWLLEHNDGPWDPIPTWVRTHREFAPVPHASVTFTDADVHAVHAAMTQAAQGADLWIMGGGGVAWDFHRAGLLDEVWLQYAPVTIGAGIPVLPGRVEMRLVEVARNRDLACLRYTVEKD